jgi:hypothetical protein
VFTARYALSPYIKQLHFVLKGLIKVNVCQFLSVCVRACARARARVCVQTLQVINPRTKQFFSRNDSLLKYI